VQVVEFFELGLIEGFGHVLYVFLLAGELAHAGGVFVEPL
jgi:hypothetical protein